MAYPKPLSEKSLERLYKESGLTEEARTFLHAFFAACANLYGAIALRHVWGIYRELKDAPKLRRKDMLTFASIVRREDQPYYVFEVNELFDEDSNNELDRHIVSKELVHVGYGKFHLFYSLMEQIDDKPYCIPDDFLSYASPNPSEHETALLDFLSNLKSVTDECVPKHGRSVPNEHKGMMLSEFSFLNSDERFELEWQKRPSAKAAFLEDCSGTAAEKILRFYKRGENMGRMSPTRTLQWLIDELEETGVEMTQEKIESLLHLTTNYHNNSRLWCLSGWKPNELAAMYRGNGPTAISFGPGLQQAFAEVAIDRDELVREIKKMCLEVCGLPAGAEQGATHAVTLLRAFTGVAVPAQRERRSCENRFKGAASPPGPSALWIGRHLLSVGRIKHKGHSEDPGARGKGQGDPPHGIRGRFGVYSFTGRIQLRYNHLEGDWRERIFNGRTPGGIPGRILQR